MPIAAPSAPHRVLVIDDDAAFGRQVSKIGEEFGLEMVIANDSSEFINTVRSWQPATVIIAMRLPDADGIELMRALVADRCSAEIIITGDDQRTLNTALRLGRARGLSMAGSLVKPARIAAVRSVLARFRPEAPPLTAADLARAIEKSLLFLVYQPKFDVRSGRYSGVEVLVRWKHPERGIIHPDQFISLAEETDLINPLTDWVFAHAARQGAVWLREGLEIDIAVNIAARNLVSLDFPDKLAVCCDQCGMERDAIILELTETGEALDSVQTMEALTRLRLKGFRLSIDDFGTGYSSMSQLQKMPFSEMKIDQSFVRTMLDEPDSKVIVEMSINLADRIGLHSVAEGVESQQLMDELIKLGCHTAQGYFLSRPLSKDAVSKFLLKDRSNNSSLAVAEPLAVAGASDLSASGLTG